MTPEELEIFESLKKRARLIAEILDDADLGNLTNLERAAIEEACDLLREVALG